MNFLHAFHTMGTYWALGILMIVVAYKKDKSLVRIEKDKVFNWIKILIIITAFRLSEFYFMKLFGLSMQDTIEQMRAVSYPDFAGTFFVFWEDAAHALALILLLDYCKNSTYLPVIRFLSVFIFMVSFGVGHTYQGYMAAAFLALYVPFGMKMGMQYGFGTIMICHTLYDLSIRGVAELYLRGM